MTPGGSIIISYRPGEVHLESATPFIGFEVEIHDDEPDRVDVEFDSGLLSYRIKAFWNPNGLIVTGDSDEPDGD